MIVSGPAFKSGSIREGDILCEIDGILVLRCTFSKVANILLGSKDTDVTLAFLRGDDKIVVNLKRQHPSSLQSLTKPVPAQTA